MPLNKESKAKVVNEITNEIAKAQTVVLAEYPGINASDLTKLRAKAREKNVYLRVCKNTLVRRAIKNTPFESMSEKMTGPLIYCISEDPVAGPNVIQDFAKSNDKLAIQSGFYAGKLLDAAGVKALASIPSREELLAKLVGVMQAPVSSFARLLAALSAQKSQNENQGEKVSA